MTEVVTKPDALRILCDAWRARGERVGLVPTMGALHPGHISLVDAARKHGATRVALTIFVNPMQFGPKDDFAKYPRTLEQDLALCNTNGVDVVYAPNTDTLYPAGFQSHVEVEKVTLPLEGAFRPTHFRGVTTIVTKLFNAAGPCVATFGRKDYQQWRAIARMAADLDMPVEVVGCPILREADGLAMSSRNRYLSADERTRALAIIAGLRAAEAAFRAGERRASELEARVSALIAPQFDSIDYVTAAHPETLDAYAGGAETPPVVLVAARIGQTRLIDNAVLGSDALN